MSSKTRANPLNGVHTSGIFSDLSIDGPVIGTLVLVVDRAKNLPNRKTIGKQDPYCAARLGKEAKKTNTDIRGGQTPRWDQELRFTVHDSPDYYQLKVSVFSDDKKTELIGENWIDLRDIVVGGGGQSDKWHQLNCRGKYAGEIRIEITYYDTRPKPEKPAIASAAVSVTAGSAMAAGGSTRGRPGGDTGGSSAMGPRAPAAPKRRPLPSDPITGQQPVQNSLPPAQATPPHPVPAMAQPTPAPAPPAPATMNPQLAGLPQQQQQQQQPLDPGQTPPRAQLNPVAAYMNAQVPSQPPPMPPVSYSNAPPQPAVYQQPLPPAQAPLPPLQSSPAPAVPPLSYQGYSDQEAYMTGPDSGYDSAPPVAHHQHQRHGHQSQPSHTYDKPPFGGHEFADLHEHQPQPYDQMQNQQDPRDYRFDAATAYVPAPAQASAPIPAPVPAPAPAPASAMASSYEDAAYMPSPVDDRPPPPPVHRSRNNSGGAAASDAMFRSSFDSTTQPTMRREVLRNEAHRLSISAYPGRPMYRPVETNTPPPVSSAPAPDPVSYQPSHPRHLSYDSYEGQRGGEYDGRNDAVSTSVQASFRTSANRPPPPSQQQQPPQPPPSQQYQEPTMYDYNAPGFDKSASPAPLNLSGHRRSLTTSPAPMYDLATPARPPNGEPSGYTRRSRSPSPMVSHDYSRRSASPQPGAPAMHSFGTQVSQDDPYQSNRVETRYQETPEAYMLPPVPSSLVPGMDTALTLELRSRIHQEQRYGEQQQQQPPPPLPQPQQQQRSYTLPPHTMTDMSSQATPPRGRQMYDEPPRTSHDYDNSPQMYTPQRSQLPQSYNTPPQPAAQPPPSRYEHSPGGYSSGGPSPAGVMKQRGGSPNPQHTIKRKSVSPAPAMAQSNGERRLSGIPFGPDSYDMLNPSVAAKDPVRPDYNEITGKIITHDGREIDPSDHLPVESWAPEPEPKPPRAESATTSPAPLSTPTSGRKQLRIAGRPQSSMGSSGVTFSSADDPGTTYTPTARNRLQKKANRQSAAAASVSSGALPSGSPRGSTPLAPLTHARQQQDNYTPPRALVRASTYDYTNENQAPSPYGTSPGRASFGNSAAPPIPAKVPMDHGAGMEGGSAGGSPYGRAMPADNYRGNASSYMGNGAVTYVDDEDRSPVMSGALSASRALPWNDNGAAAAAGGSSAELALMEEMSRIDIGTGRARRHQGRYY